jgi:UDPglucose 6-dehydrogenase
MGVDKMPSKIALLQQGKPPIYEKAIEEYLERNLARGRLEFTTDMERAVRESRTIFIAVGTP